FALGIHRIKWLAIVCCVWVCIDPFLPARTLFTWIAPSKELDALLPCFAAGTLLALFKAHIQVNQLPVIGFGILYVMFKKAVFANYLFYGFLFFLLIYISTQKWFLNWRLPADISYGVYLWGWPVQQMLVWMWPDIGAKVHLMASLALAMLCGALSWYVLEKPGIRWGQRLYQKIEQKRRPAHTLP
ncbi:MAG: acyltransferase family protein, partial [Comamonas sp.]